MRLWLLFYGFFLPTFTYAFFCPTNFNQIELGQTPSQVAQQCGKPDKEIKKNEHPEGPQEWSYFIPQKVGVNTFQPVEGTLKTQVTFDNEGKAINISVNGIGVGASTICGSQIQLGDTRDDIKNACGDPSFKAKQNANESALGAAPLPNKIIEYFYDSNPPMTLRFVNGHLESKS